MQFLGNGFHFCGNVFFAAQLERRGNVFCHGERRVVDELLVDHRHIAALHRRASHIPAIDADCALTGLIQPGHDSHQGGFAGLCSAQQHRDRAAVRGQAHRVKPGFTADLFGNAVQSQLH